jgi:GMP synthase-like glutamine amidotransferase
VLQWHGEYFHDIPEQPLARSSRYPMQAFRVANAYGLLFHPKRRSTRRRDV